MEMTAIRSSQNGWLMQDKMAPIIWEKKTFAIQKEDEEEDSISPSQQCCKWLLATYSCHFQELHSKKNVADVQFRHNMLISMKGNLSS